jgi:hypothetical protein
MMFTRANYKNACDSYIGHNTASFFYARFLTDPGRGQSHARRFLAIYAEHVRMA